ncbi:MAG: acetyl-CoA carboxylase biotin carboxyl carrier protein [Hyphomicrobiales bacterium]|nr:acetyl-CoA carboxylase biotin carboxyl carrier protein [Hyphomicrobiales bacterium]
MSNKNKTIDQSLIRDLANLLKETDLSEIEIEQDNLRVRVARGTTVQTVSAPTPVSAPATQSANDSKPRDLANDPGAVPSPMVGTAYLAPAPGAKQFVSIGEVVKEGQTVLIVEAMKTMNQIAAPRSGKVTAILVDDGQPVEFGEPLLILE